MFVYLLCFDAVGWMMERAFRPVIYSLMIVRNLTLRVKIIEVNCKIMKTKRFLRIVN